MYYIIRFTALDDSSRSRTVTYNEDQYQEEYFKIMCFMFLLMLLLVKLHHDLRLFNRLMTVSHSFGTQWMMFDFQKHKN